MDKYATESGCVASQLYFLYITTVRCDSWSRLPTGGLILGYGFWSTVGNQIASFVFFFQPRDTMESG